MLERIGTWRMTSRLGAGAHGETWRAVDDLGRIAAVKLLGAPPGDELRVLASLCHPSIVEVFDSGASPQPFLAMELAEGTPLSGVTVPLPLEEAASIVAHLADGLATMHPLGLAHGDIKDDNVVVKRKPDLSVKLVDFGTAGQGRGGSYAYASPERLAGQPTSPAADMYALGLLLWKLVHGALPGEERGMDHALAHRHERPDPPEGPPWLRQLLVSLLNPDPEARPSADDVVDALVSVGAHVPTPSPALLRHRAQHIHVPRPVDDRVRDLLDKGGVLVITGDRRAGKTHSLRRLATELGARGRAAVWLQGDHTAWSAVARALADPRLGEPEPLPQSSDPVERAYLAAVRLTKRAEGAALLVDDIEQLDVCSRRVVELLAQQSIVPLVVTAATRPSWCATRACTLSPLRASETSDLLQRLLGPGRLDAYADVCHAFAGGNPGVVIEHAIAAVRAGALSWRARAWLYTPERLDAVDVDSDRLPELSADEQRVGGVLALAAEPMELERVAALAQLDRQAAHRATHRLCDVGLVHIHDGAIEPANGYVARQLAEGLDDPAAVHRRLGRSLVQRDPQDARRIAWHAVRGNDVALARTWGLRGAEQALQHDADEACRLTRSLASLVEDPLLVALRVRALAAAGRAEEAVTLGQQHANTWRVRVALAEGLMNLGRFEDALGRVQGAAPPWDARALGAAALFRLERHEDALKATEGLAAAPSDPAHVDSWLALRTTRAQALAAAGRLTEAIHYLERTPQAPAASARARALRDACMGRLLWHDGELARAGETMLAASRISGGLSTLDRARLANNAANAAFQLGRVDQAIERWERARMFFERMAADNELVAVRLNLCVGYREVGRFTRARRCGLDALQRAQQLGIGLFEAMAAGNLGDVHLDAGDLDKAESLYRSALELAQAAEAHEEVVEDLRRLADVAARRSDAGIYAHARQALRIAERIGAAGEIGQAKALLALALTRRGDVDEAEPLLREALAAGIDDARAMAEVRVRAAEALAELGRTSEAHAQLAEARFYADECGSAALRAAVNRVGQAIGADPSKGNPEKALRALDALAALAHAHTEAEAEAEALDALQEITEATCCWLVVKEGASVELVGHRGPPEEEPPWKLIERCLARSTRIVVADIRERSDLQITTTTVIEQLKALVAVPFAHPQGVRGVFVARAAGASPSQLTEASEYLARVGTGFTSALLRIRAHKQLASDARRGRQVAHDLRNLATSLLYVAMTSEDDRSEPIEAIARSMVDLAQHHVVGRDPNNTVVHVADVARSACALARHAYEGRTRFLVSAQDGVHVRSDPMRLERALFNLLDNSARHSPADEVVVLTVAEHDGEAWISVRDRGAGLQPEAAPPEQEDGHGIGLGIVRDVALRSAGHFELTDHEEGGAIATLRLPLFVSGDSP